jgi:O-antigen ligase
MKPIESIFARAERIVVLAAVAGVPLVHYPFLGTASPLMDAKEAFLAFLVAMGLAMRAGRLLTEPPSPERRPASGRVLGMLAILWAATSLASVFCHGHPLLFFRLYLLQWSFIAWLWLLSGISRPGRCLEMVVQTSFATGLIAALGGIVQVVFPAFGLWLLPYAGKAEDPRHMVFSTLGNPEFFGGYMAAVFALGVCWAMNARSRGVRACVFSGTALAAIAMLLSGSRGPWLGAIAGAAVALLLEIGARGKLPSRRVIAGFALAGVLGLAALGVLSTPNPLNPYRANFARRIAELGDLSSISVRHRVAMAAAGARMIADNPMLGVGPARFGVEFYPALERMLESQHREATADYLRLLKGRRPGHAHNDALEFWIETGTLGFLVFAAIIAWGIAMLRRGGMNPDPRAWIVRAAAAASATLLIQSLFSFPLHLPSRGILFWTLFALGAIAALEKQNARHR